MRAAYPNELKCRLPISGNFIVNVIFIIRIIITPNAMNNPKIHCHTPDLDTEKIVLISENLQNLEIGQLYLDKGVK